jgi:hypothetical protein
VPQRLVRRLLRRLGIAGINLEIERNRYPYRGVVCGLGPKLEQSPLSRVASSHIKAAVSTALSDLSSQDRSRKINQDSDPDLTCFTQSTGDGRVIENWSAYVLFTITQN